MTVLRPGGSAFLKLTALNVMCREIYDQVGRKLMDEFKAAHDGRQPYIPPRLLGQWMVESPSSKDQAAFRASETHIKDWLRNRSGLVKVRASCCHDGRLV